MNKTARIISAMALLGITAFCIFGFMASFEPSETSRLPWQIGYGVAGVACIGGAVMLLRPRQQKN